MDLEAGCRGEDLGEKEGKLQQHQSSTRNQELRLEERTSEV